jgi:PAS domain S-box-containing protein
MNSSSLDLELWLGANLFDEVPVRIAVIDRDFNIVKANRSFRETFGDWHHKKCFEGYKNRSSVCQQCGASQTFEDGVPRVTHEMGYGENGRITRYIKHTVPVREDNGAINYLVEMSLDVTDTEQLRYENNLLFEQVPCNMTLLDRDLRIVRANGKIRKRFGNVEGRHCYEVFKEADDACEVCPARRSFEDGGIHKGHTVTKNHRGEPVHLQVTTAPIGLIGSGEDYVLEIAVDISKPLRLEEELGIAHSFLQNLISASMDGIVAVNDKNEVRILNSAARAIFQIPDGINLTGDQLNMMLPDNFANDLRNCKSHLSLPESMIHTFGREEIPVRLVGVRLQRGSHLLGMAVFIQDRTELKHLEKEKLEAERMAAVGQTVTGLAHGVKNLLTGLEGGMYMMSTGLKKGKQERIEQGWNMLDRNITRVTKFVKDFLSFSKGRTITVEPSDPVAIAREVVDLYSEKARESGITLTLSAEQINEANLDYDGIHDCLTNLVGNAIDACLMSEESGGDSVIVKVYETGGTIRFEVSDNGCGMDYEVKQKVFTTFFTTKGLGGTGIGLLTTRKIVQEHGGSIHVESTLKKGTTFIIRLPRSRLPEKAVTAQSGLPQTLQQE